MNNDQIAQALERLEAATLAAAAIAYAAMRQARTGQIATPEEQLGIVIDLQRTAELELVRRR